jgi:hypothetical protein
MPRAETFERPQAALVNGGWRLASHVADWARHPIGGRQDRIAVRICRLVATGEFDLNKTLVLAGLFLALLVSPSAAAPDPGLGEPEAFVASFYAPMVEAPVSDDDLIPADEPPVYAASLRALMQVDSGRENNYLDFDWVTGGQDTPDISRLKIVQVSRTEATASYRVTFYNYRETRERLFELVREDGRWLIEDVFLKRPENRWLSRVLVENPQD